MIFLIDDNQNNQRQNNYNITYIEDGIFDRYLMSIEKLELGNTLNDITHIEFLKKAECILLHYSTEDYDRKLGFLSGSITNVLKIKEIISQEGDLIPLVLFSNSMGEADFSYENNPYYIRSISKNIFYERLYDFLIEYKNTGIVDLRIIAWGKNYSYKQISELSNEILNVFVSKNNSDFVTLSDLSSVLASFKLFIELSNPQKSFNDVLIEIEDDKIKVIDFKSKVNKIVESYIKYGRNIYTW